MNLFSPAQVPDILMITTAQQRLISTYSSQSPSPPTNGLKSTEASACLKGNVVPYTDNRHRNGASDVSPPDRYASPAADSRLVMVGGFCPLLADLHITVATAIPLSTWIGERGRCVIPAGAGIPMAPPIDGSSTVPTPAEFLAVVGRLTIRRPVAL